MAGVPARHLLIMPACAARITDGTTRDADMDTLAELTSRYDWAVKKQTADRVQRIHYARLDLEAAQAVYLVKWPSSLSDAPAMDESDRANHDLYSL